MTEQLRLVLWELVGESRIAIKAEARAENSSWLSYSGSTDLMAHESVNGDLDPLMAQQNRPHRSKVLFSRCHVKHTGPVVSSICPSIT